MHQRTVHARFCDTTCPETTGLARIWFSYVAVLAGKLAQKSGLAPLKFTALSAQAMKKAAFCPDLTYPAVAGLLDK